MIESSGSADHTIHHLCSGQHQNTNYLKAANPRRPVCNIQPSPALRHFPYFFLPPFFPPPPRLSLAPPLFPVVPQFNRPIRPHFPDDRQPSSLHFFASLCSRPFAAAAPARKRALHMAPSRNPTGLSLPRCDPEPPGGVVRVPSSVLIDEIRIRGGGIGLEAGDASEVRVFLCRRRLVLDGRVR